MSIELQPDTEHIRVDHISNDEIETIKSISDIIKSEKYSTVYMVLTSSETGRVIGFENVGGQALANLIKTWNSLDYPVEKEEKIINPMGWDSYEILDKEFLGGMISTFTNLGFKRSKELLNLINTDFVCINLLVIS